MYIAARQWGIQPSEFWGMTMGEWFCEYEFNAKDAPGSYAGSLTNGDVDKLLDIAEMTDEEWQAEYG